MVEKIDPKSILDVGAGTGRYGLMFRELMDIRHGRYHKPMWVTQINACEAFTSYITPVHYFVYDQVFIQDFTELLNEMKDYDLIFMGAIIEHFEKDTGKQVLKRALKKCRHLIISTPSFEMEQPAVFGNPLEEHKGFWTEEDFKPYEDIWQDETHIVVLLKGEL